MSAEGWRTVIVRQPGELRWRDGRIVLAGEDESFAPVEQVARVYVAHPGVMISSSLLVALAERHIPVVLCDNKRLPACELTGLGLHDDAPGLLKDQIAWRQENKDEAWAAIVRAKIAVQERHLSFWGLKSAAPLTRYADEVRPGDATNREAMAARAYFRALFGRDFHRRAGGPVNAALNYGYAILLSEFSRVLAMHGYHLALGLHHASRVNRLNLACDLMEPFRPFVDRIVAENGERELDQPYKKELIALPYGMCRYGRRRMELMTAAEMYALDVMKTVKSGKNHIKEISFVQQVRGDPADV